MHFSSKLSRYAEDRNDALLDATSRMSPYLHYGMVSPLRLAREAAAIGGRGAEKFLDELLIWREMAHAFCFYQPDQDLYNSGNQRYQNGRSRGLGAGRWRRNNTDTNSIGSNDSGNMSSVTH